MSADEPKEPKIGPSEPPVTPDVADELSESLSRKLKAEYDALVAQPVPDRFQSLLDELSNVPASDAAESADPPNASDAQAAEPTETSEPESDIAPSKQPARRV